MDIDAIKNDYYYFSNKECRYFPCHESASGELFSCLFCYCPLYALKENCGGAFVYTASGIKDCSGCKLPHRPENYRYVVDKLCDLIEIVRKKPDSE